MDEIIDVLVIGYFGYLVYTIFFRGPPRRKNSRKASLSASEAKGIVLFSC